MADLVFPRFSGGGPDIGGLQLRLMQQRALREHQQQMYALEQSRLANQGKKSPYQEDLWQAQAQKARADVQREANDSEAKQYKSYAETGLIDAKAQPIIRASESELLGNALDIIRNPDVHPEVKKYIINDLVNKGVDLPPELFRLPGPDEALMLTGDLRGLQDKAMNQLDDTEAERATLAKEQERASAQRQLDYRTELGGQQALAAGASEQQAQIRDLVDRQPQALQEDALQISKGLSPMIGTATSQRGMQNYLAEGSAAIAPAQQAADQLRPYAQKLQQMVDSAQGRIQGLGNEQYRDQANSAVSTGALNTDQTAIADERKKKDDYFNNSISSIEAAKNDPVALQRLLAQWKRQDLLPHSLDNWTPTPQELTKVQELLTAKRDLNRVAEKPAKLSTYVADLKSALKNGEISQQEYTSMYKEYLKNAAAGKHGNKTEIYFNPLDPSKSVAPTTPVKTRLMTEFVAGKKAIGDLRQLIAGYDNSYQTYPGQGRRALTGQLSNITGTSIDAQNRIPGSIWQKKLKQFLNDYVFALSGASTAEQQIKRFEEAIGASSTTPHDEMPVVLQDLMSTIQRHNSVAQDILREGIPLSDDEFKKEFDSRLQQQEADDSEKAAQLAEAAKAGNPPTQLDVNTQLSAWGKELHQSGYNQKQIEDFFTSYYELANGGVPIDSILEQHRKNVERGRGAKVKK